MEKAKPKVSLNIQIQEISYSIIYDKSKKQKLLNHTNFPNIVIYIVTELFFILILSTIRIIFNIDKWILRILRYSG